MLDIVTAHHPSLGRATSHSVPSNDVATDDDTSRSVEPQTVLLFSLHASLVTITRANIITTTTASTLEVYSRIK